MVKRLFYLPDFLILKDLTRYEIFWAAPLVECKHHINTAKSFRETCKPSADLSAGLTESSCLCHTTEGKEKAPNFRSDTHEAHGIFMEDMLRHRRDEEVVL